MTESKSDGAKLTQPAREQAAIHWGDSGIKNSYANACTVSSTREEIVLNFGLNHTWERGQQDAKIQLTNRIILIPIRRSGSQCCLAPLSNNTRNNSARWRLGRCKPKRIRRRRTGRTW